MHLFVSEFGAKAFCSLVESRVKTKELKPFSTFAVEGVINSNILERVTNFSFRNKQVNLKILTFCFLMTFFFSVPIPVNWYEIHSGYNTVLTNGDVILSSENDFFLIGIHSMQGWTATMRHGVTRKRSTKRLKHTGNLFRKNLQLKDVC